MKSKPSRNYTRLILLILGTASLVLSPKASAQILIGNGIEAYTSQTTYNQAQTSIVDAITFNGLATPTTDPYFGSPGSLNAGGISFTTPSGSQLYTVGAQYYAPSTNHHFNFDGTTTLEIEYGSPDVLTTTIQPDASSVPVTSFGTQFGAGFTAAPILTTVTLANGDVNTFTYEAPDAGLGFGFIGFVSTDGSAIKSVTFSDSTKDSTGQILFALDNVTYGVATTAAPEPGVLSLMVMGGVVGLFYVVRRRLCLA